MMMKNQRKKRSKRAFTLIEIIICISILSLAGSLFAYKAKDLFAVYHFRNEKRKMLNAIELARHLSISYQADIEMVITKEKKGYSMILKTDEPTLFNHGMLFKSMKFKHIDYMAYLADKKEEDPIKILFSSSGWIFPAGSFEMHSFKKEQHKIDLGINIVTSS